MRKNHIRLSQKEAIKEILSAGWLPCYPVKNIPMTQQYFWDGIDNTEGYAWGAAIKEITDRRNKQLELFAEVK